MTTETSIQTANASNGRPVRVGNYQMTRRGWQGVSESWRQGSDDRAELGERIGVGDANLKLADASRYNTRWNKDLTYGQRLGQPAGSYPPGGDLQRSRGSATIASIC